MLDITIELLMTCMTAFSGDATHAMICQDHFRVCSGQIRDADANNSISETQIRACFVESIKKAKSIK